MKATVTYSPEDNKVRLYVGRVPRDEYETLRAAGFVSTPKQDCDFVATWTPEREDLAAQYLEDGEDIGDEDYSPLERSADRAERFEGYREKRADEAGGAADTFAAGPQTFGHQNLARAERQARRHDRHRNYAVGQWSKAEYWQERTAGVIAHALYRSSAGVRRSRILTLESEKRKLDETMKSYAKRYTAWGILAAAENNEGGVDELLPLDDGEMKAAQRVAYALANNGQSMWQAYHPTCEKANETARRIWNHGFSAYDFLTKTEFVGETFDRLTPRQVAKLWMTEHKAPGNPASRTARWLAHYELRLTYERAMLAEEGGSAAEADMEPGGWISTANRTGSVFTDVKEGWKQVQSVNKSPVTGRVVSVKVWGTTSGFTRASNYKKHETSACLVTVNIERLPEGAYRAPTDEERAAFAKETAERKAQEKASKPKEPALINPTDEDAERLQAIWNAKAKESHIRHGHYGECPVATVWKMTQAAYSARSKGEYSFCATSDVSEKLDIRNIYRNSGGRVTVFKVRTGSGENYGCRRVIVLTDKPQKPLPWSEVEKVAAKQPTADGLFYRLDEIAELMKKWDHNDEESKLLGDAQYVGWIGISSHTQKHWTEKGIAAHKKFEEIKSEGGTPVEHGTLFSMVGV